MNRKATWITLALLLVVWAAAWWWRAEREGLLRERREATPAAGETSQESRTQPEAPAKAAAVRENGRAADERPDGDAKQARIERIKRDYEDLALKLGEEFGRLGGAFPGGLNAYLRQLALLEREKRNDYAAFLTAAELEDLELVETRAGKEVQRWLGDAPVTEEQRRAVFRLQREYDDTYSLVFDLKAPALLARETERQALQERILGVLGPAGFASWLRGEGATFGQFQELVATRGLAPEKAIDLWRLKNEFVRENLANEARGDATDEERAIGRVALVEATKARIDALAGPGARERAPAGTFDWLERSR